MASIDGVPVVWRDFPGEVTAELAFGVGPRDEGVDRIGLSHLVQLLVLADRLPPRRHRG